VKGQVKKDQHTKRNALDDSQNTNETINKKTEKFNR